MNKKAILKYGLIFAINVVADIIALFVFFMILVGL